MASVSRWIAGVALVAVAFSGCGNDGAPEKSEEKGSASLLSAPDAGMVTALAAADAADGTADKVVSKCVTCMLHMAGKPDTTATCGEYTLHLCSKHCQESFTHDPRKALLSLKTTEKAK